MKALRIYLPIFRISLGFKPRAGYWATLVILLSVLLTLNAEDTRKSVSKPKLQLSIKPRDLVDALRISIDSHRDVYLELYTGRKSTTDPLLSPCELLRKSSNRVAGNGAEYSFVLRAFSPLNSRNSPETAVESKGLQFVGSRPDLVYTSEELLGGRWYFTAVYPEAATQQSCVSCHSKAPRENLKVGDVIGALVIRLALEL